MQTKNIKIKHLFSITDGETGEEINLDYLRFSEVVAFVFKIPEDTDEIILYKYNSTNKFLFSDLPVISKDNFFVNDTINIDNSIWILKTLPHFTDALSEDSPSSKFIYKFTKDDESPSIDLCVVYALNQNGIINPNIGSGNLMELLYKGTNVNDFVLDRCHIQAKIKNNDRCFTKSTDYYQITDINNDPPT